MKYYYCISWGMDDAYYFEILSHSKKFTKIQFVKMFNETIEKQKINEVGDISNYLRDKFGFEIEYPVKCEIEINTGIDKFHKIPLEEVKEDIECYTTDENIKDITKGEILKFDNPYERYQDRD